MATNKSHHECSKVFIVFLFEHGVLFCFFILLKVSWRAFRRVEVGEDQVSLRDPSAHTNNRLPSCARDFLVLGPFDVENGG